ncbi:MAG: metallophosphoesterase [Clostridia bacterium]|nr:metallophosphoesterase [Clostridia bacterium]
MSRILLHDYRINIKGVKRKTVYHFSDVHLNLTDELSSEEERQKVSTNASFWHEGRKSFAKAFGEPYDDELLIEADEHLESLLNKAREDGDALIMTGDIFDYVNEAHVRLFEKKFSNFPIPYVFACGNHEQAELIPDDCYMSRIKSPVQILDLDDLKIIAFDNSNGAVTREQINALKEQLSQQKPLIIAMHIPIQSENNDILKTREEYYRLNNPDCPAENLEFIELIYANTHKIPAVLAGHLHFLNVCELKPNLTQYVSSQGLLGNINRYVIGE